MNEMKALSDIMSHRELTMKAGERKMSTSRKDEGTIADNEEMIVRVLELFSKRLFIV